MANTVWITGAAGFTGRFMIDYLRNLDDAPHIVGVDQASLQRHAADRFLTLDLCQREEIVDAVAEIPPDVVIHLAGLMPPHGEDEMRRVNVGGSRNLAGALLSAAGPPALMISAGSAAEYLPGSNRLTESSPTGGGAAYGRTKSEQSDALLAMRSQGLPVIVARPFNLLGPGLSENLVAGGLCRQFMATGMSDGFIAPKGPVDSVRDFIDVRDVVRAYWTLARNGQRGEVYNVCTGHGTTIATMIEVLQSAFDVSVEVRPDYDTTLISADVSIGDNAKLTALGWQPDYSLEASLQSMAAALLRQAPSDA